MHGVKLTLVIAAVLTALWIVGGGRTASAGPSGKAGRAGEEEFERPTNQAARVPCTDVIKKINNQVNLQKGRGVDMSQLAKRLGTSVSWVERCMEAYGRRPKRTGLESSEAREERLERFEEDEAEEVEPEDVEEPGARERVLHPEKERIPKLGIRPEPTPSGFEHYRAE